MLRLLFLMVDAIDKFLDLLLPPAPKPPPRPSPRTPSSSGARGLWQIPPRRDGMEPGSEVVVLDDPLNLGVGKVASVGVDGKVRVEFKSSGSLAGGRSMTIVESFDPFDLELLDRFMGMDTLTQTDLARLRQRDTRKHG